MGCNSVCDWGDEWSTSQACSTFQNMKKSEGKNMKKFTFSTYEAELNIQSWWMYLQVHCKASVPNRNAWLVAFKRFLFFSILNILSDLVIFEFKFSRENTLIWIISWDMTLKIFWYELYLGIPYMWPWKYFNIALKIFQYEVYLGKRPWKYGSTNAPQIEYCTSNPPPPCF